MPEKKEYVSVSKGVHNQKFYNLQKLHTAFKERHPNVNIGFSKLCALRPKWFFLASSRMTHRICVCNAHQNIMLVVDAMDWEMTYKKLIKEIVCKPESNNYVTHWCEFSPENATLKEFLDQKLNEQETLDR